MERKVLESKDWVSATRVSSALQLGKWLNERCPLRKASLNPQSGLNASAAFESVKALRRFADILELHVRPPDPTLDPQRQICLIHCCIRAPSGVPLPSLSVQGVKGRRKSCGQETRQGPHPSPPSPPPWDLASGEKIQGACLLSTPVRGPVLFLEPEVGKGRQGGLPP